MSLCVMVGLIDKVPRLCMRFRLSLCMYDCLRLQGLRLGRLLQAGRLGLQMGVQTVMYGLSRSIAEQAPTPGAVGPVWGLICMPQCSKRSVKVFHNTRKAACKSDALWQV